MSTGVPIAAAYQALLGKGRLKANPGQTLLVDLLGQLQERLIAGSKPTWTRSLPITAWTSSSPASSHQQDTYGTHSHASNNSPSNGIYIYGGVGTGKSRIADLFAATLPAQISRRRAHFFEFMTDTHMRLHRARADVTNYRGDPLVQIGREIRQESSVLCLDEFQVSDIADAMILKRLFGAFWASGGIMVSTSNRHPRELYKNGLNRSLFVPFIEELQSKCTIFEMEGKHDYRMDSRSHSRGHGHDQPHAENRMEDIFFTDPNAFEASLTKALDGAKLERTEITVVMGRKLFVDAAVVRPMSESPDNARSTVDSHNIEVVSVTNPHHDKTIVSTTFTSLCEASLGPSDYHALGNLTRTSTIYMRGLRKFGRDELDVVRRFITLVDIAYESRTRIICLSSESLVRTFENIIVVTSVIETDANTKTEINIKTNTNLDQQDDDLNSNNNNNKNPSIQNPHSSRRREEEQESHHEIKMKRGGGSSSSMTSTFIDNDIEWSATGLKTASMATGGAGETDVRFAIARAVSRLFEMQSDNYYGDDHHD